MSLSLPELVIIAALSLGVALVVIGMLIGILIAIFMPRTIQSDDGRSAIAQEHEKSLPHRRVSNSHR